MKRVLVVVLMVAACASAPAPTAPDESRRVPVNKVVPPESEQATGNGRAAKRTPKVEWR